MGRCNDDKNFCRGVSISLLDRVQLDPRACGQLRASLCQVSEKMKNKLAAESEAPLRLPLLYASAVLFGKVRNKMAQMAQAGGYLLGLFAEKVQGHCLLTGRRSKRASEPVCSASRCTIPRHACRNRCARRPVGSRVYCILGVAMLLCVGRGAQTESSPYSNRQQGYQRSHWEIMP